MTASPHGVWTNFLHFSFALEPVLSCWNLNLIHARFYLSPNFCLFMLTHFPDTMKQRFLTKWFVSPENMWWCLGTHLAVETTTPPAVPRAATTVYLLMSAKPRLGEPVVRQATMLFWNPLIFLYLGQEWHLFQTTVWNITSNGLLWLPGALVGISSWARSFLPTRESVQPTLSRLINTKIQRRTRTVCVSEFYHNSSSFPMKKVIETSMPEIVWEAGLKSEICGGTNSSVAVPSCLLEHVFFWGCYFTSVLMCILVPPRKFSEMSAQARVNC